MPRPARRTSSPQLVGDTELHFMTGSTEHVLGNSLLCAAWTYAQTVALLFDEFDLDSAAFTVRVIEPS